MAAGSIEFYSIKGYEISLELNPSDVKTGVLIISKDGTKKEIQVCIPEKQTNGFEKIREIFTTNIETLKSLRGWTHRDDFLKQFGIARPLQITRAVARQGSALATYVDEKAEEIISGLECNGEYVVTLTCDEKYTFRLLLNKVSCEKGPVAHPVAVTSEKVENVQEKSSLSKRGLVPAQGPLRESQSGPNTSRMFYLPRTKGFANTEDLNQIDAIVYEKEPSFCDREVVSHSAHVSKPLVPQVEERICQIVIPGSGGILIGLNVFPRGQLPFPSEIVSGFVAAKIEDQDVLVSVQSIMDAINYLEEKFNVRREDSIKEMESFLGIHRHKVLVFDWSFVEKRLIEQRVPEAEEIAALLKENEKESREMLSWATSKSVRIKKGEGREYSLQYSVDELGAVKIEVTGERFAVDVGGRKSIRDVILIDSRRSRVLANFVRLRERVKTEVGPLSEEYIASNERSLIQESFIAKILHEKKIPFVTKAYSVLRTTKRGEDKPHLYMKKYKHGDFKGYIAENQDDPDFFQQSLLKMTCFLHALSCMHKGGICHRDIKLENALIDKRDVLRLSDFDSAVTEEPQFRKFMQVRAGTHGYIPPEQFIEDRDFTIDDMKTADMFAVGVSLLFFLPSISREACYLFRNEQRLNYKNVSPDYLVSFCNQIKTMQVMLQKIGEKSKVPKEKGLCKLISDLISFDQKSRPTAEDAERRLRWLLRRDMNSLFESMLSDEMTKCETLLSSSVQSTIVSLREFPPPLTREIQRPVGRRGGPRPHLFSTRHEGFPTIQLPETTPSLLFPAASVAEKVEVHVGDIEIKGEKCNFSVLIGSNSYKISEQLLSKGGFGCLAIQYRERKIYLSLASIKFSIERIAQTNRLLRSQILEAIRAKFLVI